MFHRATYNKFGMVHCIYVGATCLDFQNNIVFLSLEIDFTLANSVEADKMPHYAAFILIFTFSQSLGGFSSTKG